MDRQRRFYRTWLLVWLATLLCLPVVEAMSVHDAIHRACFAIVELQFEPLPGGEAAASGDGLWVIKEGVHKGRATICTNQDRYLFSVSSSN
jgi:hypothetical protein